MRDAVRYTKSPKALLGLILVGAAFSQQSSRPKTEQPKTEFCGRGGEHECHCLLRTQLLQDEHRAACEQKFDRSDKKQERQWLECGGKEPSHCDVAVDSVHYSHPWIEDADTHVWMDGRCTVGCKKHHCKCDDGPVCKDVP